MELKLKIKELKEDLLNKKLKTENLEEEKKRLIDEIELQKENIEHFKKINIHNENNQKTKKNISINQLTGKNTEGLSAKQNIEVLNEIVFNSTKENITKFAIRDFEKIKNRYIPNTEKNNSSDLINNTTSEMIKIKFNDLEVLDPTPLKIRVINNFYTILDLFEDICSLKNIDMRNFIFFNEKEERVSVLQTVSSYLFNKKDEIGETYLLLKRVKMHNRDGIAYEDQEDQLKVIYDLNEIEVNILDDQLENVEESIITRSFYMILYMCFLCLLVPFNLQSFKIMEGNYIHETVNKQLFKKSYSLNNKFGLNNDFESINDNKQFNDWMRYIFPYIFEYEKIKGFIIKLLN